ncbi:glycosyltransferase family 2 protein [Flagellimonas halotolerans]|uniref:Glycosyltransferase family 2 protein n=1 Tax=Flagellimonas halotolerans TaxID=3112164 RepID=A0ABU6ISU6_9FLAO|nr:MULTISPECIES: glycosyltransferase family 2 protein [unclassified Allomuricauda]MEC3966333.1 glycosyltransferase family 2 protein [Muricauda sp. SYSU M86414]MEC4266198.1 glycosyltransferase family 2 protein [Muricauda sp. SYSU M84420]
MRISIVIPAHNEAAFLKDCLDSFVAQTYLPNEIIVVDDNSSDDTFKIAQSYAQKYNWIKVLQRNSTDKHVPGKKVIDTFNFGLEHTLEYDFIGKFDADIILPNNYFELIVNQFKANWKLGMCSGLLYIKKAGDWVYENIADKNHIRGPIKLYRKACFNKIGRLRPDVGWDTVDTLLAKYHDFDTLTLPELKVKHLRPTGHGYSSKNHQTKGVAMYKMRYGIVLTKIAALKMAWQTKNPGLYFQAVFGYFKAFFQKQPRYVSKQEGKFIRSYRWKGIWSKFS